MPQLALLWPPYGIGRPLYFHPVVYFIFFFLSFFFLFPRLISAVADWMSTILYTWCGLSANLGCRSEMCCTRLAGNTGRKNDAKNRHLCTIAQICWAISSQLRHISTIVKILLSNNTSSICPRNMVNFGPLAAEISPVVWGTPANFNGFRVVAALLHDTLVVGVSQTLLRGTEGATNIRQGGHHVGH